MKNKLTLIIVVIILFAFSTALMAEEDLVKYTDDLGREIKLESEVQRIISLAPSVTETIYELGREYKLVAVSSACDYPKAALQKENVGRIDEPNIEKIVALEPDLVIASSATKIESLERLTELGIKNIGFKPESINDTIKMIEDIAYLISAENKGVQISLKLKKDYQRLKELVTEELKNKKRPRVFYQIWSDPLYTAGKGTFIDSLIHDAGGFNIARKAAGSWPTYSSESLVAADPEVYISSKHSSPEGLTLEEISKKKIYREVSAFKNNRIYLVEQDLVNRPSPRIIEGYKEFIKAILPQLKKEID